MQLVIGMIVLGLIVVVGGACMIRQIVRSRNRRPRVESWEDVYGDYGKE